MKKTDIQFMYTAIYLAHIFCAIQWLAGVKMLKWRLFSAFNSSFSIHLCAGIAARIKSDFQRNMKAVFQFIFISDDSTNLALTLLFAFSCRCAPRYYDFLKHTYPSVFMSNFTFYSVKKEANERTINEIRKKSRTAHMKMRFVTILYDDCAIMFTHTRALSSPGPSHQMNCVKMWKLFHLIESICMCAMFRAALSHFSRLDFYGFVGFMIKSHTW